MVRFARDLEELREHPGWARIHELFEMSRKKYAESLSRRLLYSGDAVDQREIDFRRGYYRAAHDFFERPEKAIADLERAAREAYREAVLEYVTQEEGAEPYA